MMSDLFWLTNEQLARLQPYFPQSHGLARVDDRRVLRSLSCVNRSRPAIGAYARRQQAFGGAWSTSYSSKIIDENFVHERVLASAASERLHAGEVCYLEPSTQNRTEHKVYRTQLSGLPD